MKHTSLFLLFFVFTNSLLAQKTIDKLLKKHNTNSIPYINVEELASIKTDAILLDSRELKEYKTSHLKNAIHIGYDHFNIDTLQNRVPNKNSKIVVYCSLGIRSEDVAEKLKKAGYNNVENLYGGIFEWKNNNLPIYNTNEKETDSVHTFSKDWSKWLKKGIKTYE
ncbi:MAG: rhodanese-like domain-containing protein [Algibacter sp.]